MLQLHLLWAWTRLRIATIRDESERDAGFTTLEWCALAGVVIIAAIAVATVLMNKAKSAAGNINLQ